MARLKVSTYYYLARPDAKDKTNVMCLIGYKSDRKKISTRISLSPKDWDNAKRLPKKSEEKLKLQDFEDTLEEVGTAISKAVKEGEEITTEIIRDTLNAKLDQKETGKEPEDSKDPYFASCINRYYQVHLKTLAWNTVKKYDTLRRYFEENYPNLKLSELTPKWAEEMKVKDLEKGQLDNTISKRFQLIRTVIKWMQDNEEIDNFNFRGFSHNRTEKNEHVFLTTEQIQQIEALDLSNKPTHDNIRSLFLLSSYLGLDWIDLPQVKKANLHKTPSGHKYFKILRRKTKKREIFSYPPLTPEAEAILKRIDWSIHQISADKSRKYLKEICFYAGFTQPVTLTFQSGSKEISETRPFFDWVGWKSGRRSFITNHYLDGLPTAAIASAVGHTKHTTTEIYNKAGAAEWVEILMSKGGRK